MSRQSTFSIARRVFATVVMSSLSAASASAGPRPASLPAWDTAAIERARAGAAKRLGKPECQKVLSDFTDADGKTLLQNLETWQLGAPDYLQVIRFVDGSSIRNCRQTSVQLTTPPGLPAVYVCPAGHGIGGSRFAQTEIRNSSLAEFMVIHEMLHTLGLGENPPSTFEITDRVKERCR
jgi:hypothetical protein